MLILFFFYKSLIITQPNPTEISVVKENTTPSPSQAQSGGIRNHTKLPVDGGAHEFPFILSPTQAVMAAATRRFIPIRPAPLVSWLLERSHSIYESTLCPVLTLRDLEANLQLIYFKSLVLSNLIIKEGCSVVQQVDRMTTAAG